MRLTLLLVTGAAAWTACAARPVAVPEVPAGLASTTVVLLRDPDSGVVGRAVVSTASGLVELAAERDAIRVVETQPPGSVATMTEAEIVRTFGAALSALPPAPHYFTVHFRFDSDSLTDESVSRVPAILQVVRERRVPDVIVVGHTDTMGAADANYALGLARARMVRDLLLRAGLDHATIEVTSHGERTLLVPTADETHEPRNRRVDVVVR